MGRARLEAFSDGVIAILITIMVLELKVPQGTDWHALASMRGVFLAYVLSFVYLGIYWNNHHHMLHTIDRINGRILWANLHLLFWLSLVPFATAWVGEHGHVESVPTAVYGLDLLLAGVAYVILQHEIIRHQGPQSTLKALIGNDRKGTASWLLYIVAVPLAFVEPWLSIAIYVFVAAMWLIPDKRIESGLHSHL